jgi:hypothetical protein
MHGQIAALHAKLLKAQAVGAALEEQPLPAEPVSIVMNF